MFRLESTELDQTENDDYSMMSSPLSVKKDKRDDSDNDKPRGRKKQSLLDQEDSLSMDELSKSVQESKSRSGLRGRKRATSESDDQQWPDKRLKEDLEFEDEQNSPPKKGRRGRPPKAIKASTAKEEPVAKTPRRGRKRAAAIELPQDEEEESLDMPDEQVYENVEPKKRGRGRGPAKATRKSTQK